MLDGLEQMGLSQATMCKHTGVINDPTLGFIHAHIDETSHKAIDRAVKPVVVTLRNPVSTFKSFCRRNSVDSEQLIINAMDKWSAVVDKFDPFIFKVDSEAAEEKQFNRLIKFLGMPIERSISIELEKYNHHIGAFVDEIPDSVFKLAEQYGYKS